MTIRRSTTAKFLAALAASVALVGAVCGSPAQAGSCDLNGYNGDTEVPVTGTVLVEEADPGNNEGGAVSGPIHGGVVYLEPRLDLVVGPEGDTTEGRTGRFAHKANCNVVVEIEKNAPEALGEGSDARAAENTAADTVNSTPTREYVYVLPR